MTSLGYGDAGTWGAITSRQDPRYRGWSGAARFGLSIGPDETEVQVEVEIYEDELDVIRSVNYQGVNVLPVTGWAERAEIKRYFERHFDTIKKANHG
jgi:hypothetical protein